MRLALPALAALCCTAQVACTGRIGDEPAASPGPRPTTSPSPSPSPTGSPSPSPSPTTCARPAPPVTPRLGRLSFSQYDASVQALVGLPVTPSTELGPEVEGLPPVMWAGLQSAADSVARQVMANATARGRIVNCTPSGDGSACAREVISRFGRQAYRRSLSTAEVDRYLALYTDRAQLTQAGTFDQAIEVILAAFLQAPAFLLRVERSTTADGDRIVLSGSELATRLAYTLWDAPPDEALLAAAERGELDTREGVVAQARRMLSTPEGVAKARAMMRGASREWLGMTGAYAQFWSNTQRDPGLFPQFYAGIDADFREEVLRFVDHVVFDQDGTFSALFTSTETLVNDRLAPIYGVTPPAADTWSMVDVGPGRPGLLSRAGFVGTHGRYGRGSLIFRGAFVLTRLMCTELGSPPAGADATPLPDASAMARTTRERVTVMTQAPQCAGCHQTRINPAGFALESFDGIGRARTEDNGVAVDTTGSLTIDGRLQSFTDVASYTALMAHSSDVRRCWVQRFAEHTFADHEVDLGCAKAELADKLGDPQLTLKDALVEIVASDTFRYRSAQEAP